MRGVALRRNMQLQLPTSFVEIESDEMEYIEGGGFIGFRVHFSQKIRRMGALGGSGAVAVAVGKAASSLRVFGPWGLVAAGAVTTIATGIAYDAINKGLSAVNIGIHADGVKSQVKHLYV